MRNGLIHWLGANFWFATETKIKAKCTGNDTLHIFALQDKGKSNCSVFAPEAETCLRGRGKSCFCFPFFSSTQVQRPQSTDWSQVWDHSIAGPSQLLAKQRILVPVWSLIGFPFQFIFDFFFFPPLSHTGQLSVVYVKSSTLIPRGIY